MEDGKCGAGNLAITAAKKLIELGGLRFLLAGCSGQILQVAPRVNGQKVLTTGHYSGTTDITDKGGYVFRIYTNFAEAGKQLAQLVIERGHTPVAILTAKSSFTLIRAIAGSAKLSA